MLTIRVENHQFPSAHLPTKPASVEGGISFSQLIDPFVKSLQLVRFTGGLACDIVLHYSYSALSVVAYVLARLIFEPIFNPLDPSFKTVTLANFENQVPLLQARIDELDYKFKHNNAILNDMKNLQQLNAEIVKNHQTLRTYLDILNSHQEQLPIKDEIERIQALYEDLDSRMNQFVAKKGEKDLFNRFENILDIFLKSGVDLHENICKELVQTWRGLRDSVGDRLTHLTPPPLALRLKSKLNGLKHRMEMVEHHLKDDSSVGSAHPLKLRNVGGVSCYLDSALQCLASIESICEQLNVPIPQDPKNQSEYLRKLAVQQELLQFLKVQKMNQGSDYSEMEYILSLLGGPSNRRLMDEIFDSSLHTELDKSVINSQQDAAYILELMIDHFLPNCRFKMREMASTKELKGIEFEGREEVMKLFSIPLKPKPKEAKDEDDMAAHIRATMDKHLELDPDRLFDPTADNAKSINDELASASKAKPATKVPHYLRWYRLTELPEVLTLQFKRFEYDVKQKKSIKIDTSVVLPKNGIVDLSRYYDASENDPAAAATNCKYKIKSYVVHHGVAANSGHYIAYVEIKGKYYYCDDLDSEGYCEITKEEFFGCKDAYLVCLERLPDEEMQAGG